MWFYVLGISFVLSIVFESAIQWRIIRELCRSVANKKDADIVFKPARVSIAPSPRPFDYSGEAVEVAPDFDDEDVELASDIAGLAHDVASPDVVVDVQEGVLVCRVPKEARRIDPTRTALVIAFALGVEDGYVRVEGPDHDTDPVQGTCGRDCADCTSCDSRCADLRVDFKDEDPS